jgi:hypothetical protein
MGEKYVRSQEVVSRVIAGETLAVPIRRGVGDLNFIYTFNEVASFLWESLAEPRSAGELVARVREEFEVSEEQASADVQNFLNDLRNAALVKIVIDDPSNAG